jgi:hypothetical protein
MLTTVVGSAQTADQRSCCAAMLIRPLASQHLGQLASVSLANYGLQRRLGLQVRALQVAN